MTGNENLQIMTLLENVRSILEKSEKEIRDIDYEEANDHSFDEKVWRDSIRLLKGKTKVSFLGGSFRDMRVKMAEFLVR